MTGEGITDSRRPLDTSELGSIRVEPIATDPRARIVRDALRSLSVDSKDRAECEALAMVVIWASDETLARLGRMVR